VSELPAKPIFSAETAEGTLQVLPQDDGLKLVFQTQADGQQRAARLNREAARWVIEQTRKWLATPDLTGRVFQLAITPPPGTPGVDPHAALPTLVLSRDEARELGDAVSAWLARR
jgi:hypothetical protein